MTKHEPGTPSSASMHSTLGEIDAPAQTVSMDNSLYENLYESHGRVLPEEESIGGGNYDLIGRIELEILKSAGLRPEHALLDFGCGTGRLAVHAIRFLEGGEYLGTDISRTILDAARRRASQVCADAPCKVGFEKQMLERFDLPDARVDMICAFSVFTHMEHEDTYKYLVDARRVLRDSGRFVFSCLPMSLSYSREVFRISAAASFAERWQRVRDVTTSVDMMDQITALAGFRVVAWHPGDVPNVQVGDAGVHALGQSVCVLAKA